MLLYVNKKTTIKSNNIYLKRFYIKKYVHDATKCYISLQPTNMLTRLFNNHNICNKLLYKIFLWNVLFTGINKHI